MLVNQAFVLPHFKTDPQLRHYVQPMGGGNCCLIVVVLDVMRSVDIVAVIEKVNAVEGRMQQMILDPDQPMHGRDGF